VAQPPLRALAHVPCFFDSPPRRPARRRVSPPPARTACRMSRAAARPLPCPRLRG